MTSLPRSKSDRTQRESLYFRGERPKIFRLRRAVFLYFFPQWVVQYENFAAAPNFDLKISWVIVKNVSVTWVEYISDGEGCQPHQTTLRWLVDANVSSYKRILRFQAIWFPVHISTCEKRQYNHIYIWLGSCYCETLTILVEVKLTLEVLDFNTGNSNSPVA